MRTARILAIAAGAALTVSASAAPTFIISVGDTIITRTGAVQNQFALTDNITSMTITPGGDVIGTSSSDDGNGLYELYRIDNPTTAPTLALLGDFLTVNTPSLTYVGNTLYGIQDLDATTDARLVTIDIGAQTETVVGQTGVFPVNAAGSAYDAATNTFFAMGKGNPGELYDLDYSVVSPNDPTAAFIGFAGINYNNHAGEWFGGKFYGVAQNSAGGGLIDVYLGEINPNTGAFNVIAQLLDNVDQNDYKNGTPSIGLAVIPTPGSAAVLGLAALGLTRRRR